MAFKTLIWAGVVLAQIAFASPAMARFVLEVHRDDGEAIFSAELDEGSDWCVHWNHSVAGILVRDCYRVHQGQMMLERAHHPDFSAAGLGQIPGRGELVAAPEGGYWIENIDEFITGNSLRMRLGALAVDHRIVLDDIEHSLSAIAAREPVTLSLRPLGPRGEKSC